jgi:glycerol-3-phosphate dehydrogenase (NAD(P)+)
MSNMAIGEKSLEERSVTVIGCGRWGSMIAHYLDSIGESVILYEPSDSPTMQAWQKSRHGEIMDLPESITLDTNLEHALANDIVVISIGSQNLRGLMGSIASLSPQNKKFVLCMKGIEIETGMRLTEIVREALDDTNSVSVWVGPGHVQDLLRGIPTCMVIDGEDRAVNEYLAVRFSSKLIRIYYGSDLIGTEVGAAAKNVIGIGAGLLDGADMSSLKGALISRGAYEVSRLIEALGGDPRSAYGLAHLGDYEATVFSPHSHNRAFGEAHVRGEKFEKLAEGYYTADALMRLAEKHGLELPIMQSIYNVIHNKHDLHAEIEKLFSAPLTTEFSEREK